MIRGQLEFHNRQTLIKRQTWTHRNCDAVGTGLTKEQWTLICKEMGMVDGVAKQSCKYESAADVKLDLAQFVADLETTCPLVSQVLHAMFVTSYNSRNEKCTADWKMERGAWLLGLMAHVRSKDDNHLPLFTALAFSARGLSSDHFKLLYGMQLSVSIKTLHNTLKAVSAARQPHEELNREMYLALISDNFNKYELLLN